MAASKLLIASILLSAFLLHLVQAALQPPVTPVYSPATPTIISRQAPKLDCKAACLVRCSKTKRPNLCQRACGSCCTRCNCVPPGTYGNYDVCPCYATLTTRGNKLKCP